MRLRLLFDGMKQSRNLHFTLTNRLSNFAKIFDHQQSQFAFEMIQNWTTSKAVNFRERKEKSCRDLL